MSRETTTVRLDDLPSMIRWIEHRTEREIDVVKHGYEGAEKRERKRAIAHRRRECRPIVYADIASETITATTGGDVSVIVDCLYSKEVRSIKDGTNQSFPREMILNHLRPLMPPGLFAELERWALAIRPRSVIENGRAVMHLPDVEPCKFHFGASQYDSLRAADVHLEVKAETVGRRSLVFFYTADIRTLADFPEDFRKVVKGYGWESIGATLVLGSAPDTIKQDTDSISGAIDFISVDPCKLHFGASQSWRRWRSHEKV